MSEDEQRPVAVTPDLDAQTTLRLAIKGVVGLTALTISGAVILLMAGHTAPDGLVAVAAGGVGALATLLSQVIRSK